MAFSDRHADSTVVSYYFLGSVAIEIVANGIIMEGVTLVQRTTSEL